MRCSKLCLDMRVDEEGAEAVVRSSQHVRTSETGLHIPFDDSG